MPVPVDRVPFLVTATGTSHLSRKQARGRAFVAPSRGVRLRADSIDDPRAVDAAALIGCRADAILSDVSAAKSWGLPLPPSLGLDDSLPRSVAVPADEARPKRVGVRGRRLILRDEHLTQRDGLRITTPARTWIDCSAWMATPDVVAMGDAILRRHLSTRAELSHLIDWARGRRGVVAARKAWPILDAHSASPGESLARAELVLGGVPKPQCNIDIRSDGQWLARADMVWEAEKVIAEYDGAVHIGERQRRHDAARRNLLQEAGWLVIVLTARDLKQPHQMCELVRSALCRAACTA